MDVTAIILAAGRSTRFGAAKQYALLAGETLLARAIRVAHDAGCARVLAVLPPGDWIAGAEIVPNPDAAQGISTSIRAGIAAAQGGRTLLMLCDQPLITARHLRSLIATNAPIVATSYASTIGVPAVFDRRFRPELMALTGDCGARLVIEAHRPDVVALPFADAAVDIDTREDLARLAHRSA